MRLHSHQKMARVAPDGVGPTQLGRDGRDRRVLQRSVVVALAALLVGISSGDLLHWGGSHIVRYWADAGWTCAALAACLACGRTVWRTRGGDRLVWLCFATADGFWLIGQLAWDYFDLGAGFPPSPNIADIGFLAFAPLALIGLLLLGRGTRAAIALLSIDIVLVSLALSLLSFTVLHSDIIHSPLDVAGRSTALLYLIVYGTLLVAILAIPLRRMWGNPSLCFLFLGVVCEVVSFVAWTPLLLHGTYVPGGPIDVIWMSGMGFMALSASTFRRFPEIDAEAQISGLYILVPLGLAGAALIATPSPAMGATLNANEQHLVLLLTATLLGVLLARVLLTVRGNRVLLLEARMHSDAIRRLNITLSDSQEHLLHQALHDSLTDLPNRTLLHDRLEHALERAARERMSHALLFLDLDNFKRVNDSLGHDAGDALLRAVAARLRASVRSQDTVARLGGDEFAILLEETDRTRATQVCLRVAEALRTPMTVGERELTVKTSIGIALSDTVPDADGLLRAADAAMYVAKRSGKGRWAFYNEGLHATLADQSDLQVDLEQAITAEALEVHYQPIIAFDSGAIVGVEALTRWTHPTRGPISPATFIPLAEESGLIGDLDTLVLRRACTQVAAWHSAGLPALRLAVNLSGRELWDPNLPERIAQILQDSQLDPAQLELELTETVAVTEDADTLAVLGALRAQGVRLALDDFGTGYSIMRRLHRLPFTTLKIDRSFIADMAAPARAELVPLVINVGHSLGLEVVAEGVETIEQAQSLREHGCEYAQGYAFSRPMAAHALTALLQRMAVAEEMSSSTPVIRALLAELGRLTGLESTYLTRIDWTEQEQEICVAHNSGPLAIAEGLRVAWSDTLCRRALDGGPRATSDVPSVYPDSVAAQDLGLQTYVSVPVRDAHLGVTGTLCGASQASVAVGADTVALLEQVAETIAQQLEHEGARRAS